MVRKIIGVAGFIVWALIIYGFYLVTAQMGDLGVILFCAGFPVLLYAPLIASTY